MTLRVFVLWAACCTASCSTSAVRKGDRVVVLYGGDACMSPAPLPPNPSDAVVAAHMQDAWMYRACEARMNENGWVASWYDYYSVWSFAYRSGIKPRSAASPEPEPAAQKGSTAPDDRAAPPEREQKTENVKLLADYYQRLCKPPLREDATKTFGQSVLGKQACEALAKELQCAFEALRAKQTPQDPCPKPKVDNQPTAQVSE